MSEFGAGDDGEWGSHDHWEATDNTEVSDIVVPPRDIRYEDWREHLNRLNNRMGQAETSPSAMSPLEILEYYQLEIFLRNQVNRTDGVLTQDQLREARDRTVARLDQFPVPPSQMVELPLQQIIRAPDWAEDQPPKAEDQTEHRRKSMA